jgi:uncharacterized protein YgiM (DUF1202 family)
MRQGTLDRPIAWGSTRVGIALVFLLIWLGLPLTGAAQEQTCTDCMVYAGMELNLRQDPSQDSQVLRTIPAGAELIVAPEAAVNGYTPVTYDRVPGWVATEGIAAPAKSVGGAAASSTTVVDEAPSSPTVDESQRVTLAPLTLRNGPAMDAEPMLVMPEGSLVTLTGEGVENGYITVDYNGETGWAYADFLSEVNPAS